MPAKAVAKTERADIVPVEGIHNMTMAQFEELLRTAKETPDEDSDDAYMRVIRQVFSAKTPDDVLTPVEAFKAPKLVGHGLILQGFEFNDSEYDVGSPMYGSMQCVYIGLLPPQMLEALRCENPSPPLRREGFEPYAESGDEIVVNCGHKKVLAQLVQLARLDGFPQKAVIVPRGRSKVSGEPMLTLIKWGDMDEDGTPEPQEEAGEEAPF